MQAMATRQVSYEQVFWQSRVSTAFRTGWACFMVGVMMQYSNMHKHWLAFPVFAYVMAVTVVGEASLGEALRAAWSVIEGTIHGVCPTIIVMWLINPVRFSLWVTTVCVTVSCFLIAFPKGTHTISKRVAFSQVVIIYVSAYIMRETLNSVTYPLRVAGTTALGAACAVLALILPIPRLACYQVQEKSKLSARITSEVLRLLVEAFHADDYTEADSLCSQAKSLSSAGASILKQVEDKRVDIKWELAGLRCTPSLRVLSKEFDKLKQFLVGMEMALRSFSSSQIGNPLYMLLKEPLLYLTDWTCLALKHAGSVHMRTTSMRTHMELIMEEGKGALNSFDEALSVVIQRVYYYSHTQKLSASKLNALGLSLHALQSNNSLNFGFTRNVEYHLATFFFLFNMKLLCKEAIDIFPCSARWADKMQQVAQTGQRSETYNDSDSESSQRSDFCRECAVPRGSTIWIGIETREDQVTAGKCKLIWKCLRKLTDFVDRERVIIALKCSLALGLSIFFGILFSQDRGFWAGIAVAISMSTSREATFKLANVRAQGTVAGSVYGVVACVLTQRFILLRVIALIPWVVFTSFLRQSKMYGYAGGLSAFIAAVIILGRKNVDPPSEFAIIRITETFIGISCYILVELILQPRRASTFARKELILSLGSLKECTTSFISAQTGKHCVHSSALALADLREKEKMLKSHISQLRTFIEEAKIEPDFWFLPFPGNTYSKLLGCHKKMVDMLHFAICSFEAIIRVSSFNCVPMDRIYGPIRDDLRAFESLVSPAFQCFREVLQIKCIRHFIPDQHNLDGNHSEFINSSPDIESGTRNKQQTHSAIPPPLHPPECRCINTLNKEKLLPAGDPSTLSSNLDNNIADDNDNYDHDDLADVITHSLVEKFQEIVTDLCLAEPEETEFNNELVLSFSALAFCLDGIMKESKELEKAIRELLQWENPWSLIDVWKIHSMFIAQK